MKLKALLITVSVLIAVTVGVWFGISMIPTSPPTVMKKLYVSYNNQDLDSMMSCLEPDLELAYQKSNEVIGKLLGIGFNDIAGLGSVFEDIGLVENMDINPSQIDILSVRYSGSRIGDWANGLPEKIPFIGNIIGKQADISFSYPNINSGSITFVKMQFEYFENIGWRIVGGSIDYKNNSVTAS